MRRGICAALAAVLALACCANALAEPVLYDDQEGVRVFVEEGRAGLMDAAGGIRLPAAYDAITPFGGSDWAMLSGEGGMGVVRRDGEVIVPCAWESVELYPEARAAVAWDDYEDQTLYDLDTGEVWQRGRLDFNALGDVVLAMTYGELGFGPDAPYHTVAYGPDREVLFELEGEVIDRLEDGWIAWLNSGNYALLDGAGGVIRDDFDDLENWDGRLRYTRIQVNALNCALKPWKLDRKHLRKLLKMFGITGSVADFLTAAEEDRSCCGVIDGERTLETFGEEMTGPDDAGLYLVHREDVEWSLRDGRLREREVDRWGYLRADGTWALPPRYEDAGPFVGDTAAVCEDGVWRLIDVTGAQVGPFRWTDDNGLYDGAVNAHVQDMLALPVVAMPAPEGIRLLDRSGALWSEQAIAANDGNLFNGRVLVLWKVDREEWRSLEHNEAWLTDGESLVCLRLENWTWTEDAPDELWVQQDGLYGCVDLRPGHLGQWRVPPTYDDVLVETSVACAQVLFLPEGGAVYGDGAGHVFGPAPYRTDEDDEEEQAYRP